MYNFDQKLYEEHVGKIIGLIPQMEAYADAVTEKGYNNIMLLGVGGTIYEWETVYGCMSKRTDFPIVVENAAEFLIKSERALSYLNKNTLVITTSVSGDTKEIVQAVKVLKERGNTVLGFTKNQETPLGQLLDYFLPMDTHFCENFYLLYFTLLMCLMDRKDQVNAYERWKEQLPLVYEGLNDVYAKTDLLAKDIVRKYHKAPYSLWVGSGPVLYPCIKMITTCLLEEMQWIRVRPVTSADFFHGTIEMVEDGVPVFVVKGVDEYRALDQRVENFLNNYKPTDSAVVYDLEQYPIHGVDDQFKDIASAAVFSACIIDRIPKYYEFFNGHSLAFRRYYRQLDY